MTGSTADRNPFERLAEDFAERLRRGEHPAITDYIARHPEHADDIRDLFPEIAAVEQCKPSDGESRTSSSTAIPVRPGRLPDQLGDYRILRYLGAGGMGVVYEAVRESLRNNVALKVMHPQFRDREQYARRFRIEARSAARLHHTNIVSVFDYGVHDGVCYYAMQYIAGHSLDKILTDVRQLRGEKEILTAGAAAATASEAQAPTRSDPWLTPSEPGEAPTCASSRALSLGLMTGEWSATASPRGPDDREAQPEPATTVAMENRGNLGPPEDDAEKGVQRTALRMLAAELAGSDEVRSLAPGQEAGPDDEPRCEQAALFGSSSSLTAQGEVRYYREIGRLGAQVADALAHAHKRGVLHRDIKPSNLILDGLGNIWITDFGLAKFEDGDDLSHTQDLVGTLRFMAPERFRGVSEPRCDVYALGATLYEMVTLRPCFSGQSHAQLIHRIEHEPPVPPRQIERGIPADLETIVLKALAKVPGDRFESADEMGAELRRYVENRPIRSRPIPAYQRIWRWCRRNPALAAAGTMAAAAIVGLAVVSTVAAWTYSDQVEALKVEQQQTRNAERRARLELGNSLVTEGAALQRSGLVGQRFDSLDRLARAAQILGADPEGRHRLPEIRNHVITGLGLVDLRVRLERDVGDFRSLAFDAPLERYTFCESSGDVVVCQVDDGHELLRLSIPNHSDYFTSCGALFSPDGGLLVTCDRRPSAVMGIVMRIWNLGRGELLAELEISDGPAFDHDGQHLAFGAPQGGIAVWDRNERRVVRRLPLDFTPGDMLFDPEGRRLAVANRDRAAPRVVILEAETGQVLTDWRTQVGNTSPAWSADGQLLAVGGVGGDDPRVYVWNVGRKSLQSVLQGHTNMVTRIEFAHSGYLVATTGHDGTARLWDGASGEPLAVGEAKRFLRFATDDRRMAFETRGRIGVCDVSTAPERRTLHSGMAGNRAERWLNRGVQAAQFNPDAQLLATAAEDGVRVWDADTCRELAHLKAGKCASVLFDSDGRGVVTSGSWGAYRWPIGRDSAQGPDTISIGPPELLWESISDNQWPCASWLPDRRTLAIIDNARAQVVLVDSRTSHPAQTRAIALDAGENRRMTTLAVSPDGRWVAAGGWYSAGVTVWDLPGRRLERILRPQDATSMTKFFVGFSPDGRWLTSSTHPDASPFAYHFWRTGTWELDRRIETELIGEHTAFTGDSRLMALCIGRQVALADAATGRELARLSTVPPVAPTPLSFSPDGTKLVVSTDRNTAHVWDLRRVRDQLTTMGLDWDAPAYPAATEHGGPLPPRAVRVVGEVRENQARRAGELAEMDRRIAADPNDADALIRRGWLRLNLSKPAKAVVDLERCVRLRPDDTDALFLLSQAYSQSNNLRAARAALETYLTRCPDDTDARIKKGQIAIQLRRLPEAADEFTRVLEAEPRRNQVRSRRAAILLRLRRFAEALADLNTLIQRYPEDPALVELRSQAHDGLGDREQAQVDRKRAAELPRADARYYNDLAWRLATGPVVMRDPERALAAARKAVALAPGSALYLNTLGVAQFRAGLYAEAIDTLEKSLAASKGETDAFDLFFLALARRRLGHVTEARADFDRALLWRRDHPNLSQSGWAPELDAFQAEAEAALADPKPDLPDDVFAPPTEHPRGR
jgi:serine/threonine protein kinase/WD40 repeat protein/tetratricopeptide (TPR) repeat protein